MEISHASTETQSAAVGIKGKAEEVTVSADAEFMMMIAHGIYSNKPLALARELLCNGRDGHAKAGCLDKPIIVTIDDNKIVVRDHGTGIPNEIFAPTYLTFGKSTKRKDKSATGGFGVGSKVPWAVCDTFSTRNFINGTMTAYVIMKSDPALEGKPSCTPIMTIPSTEPSGVEVSVPFPEKMRHDIERAVENFSAELNIPVILNGVQLRNGAESSRHAELVEHKFVMLNGTPKTCIQRSPFYVQQGDVLYPIERQEEFADAYDMLLHLNPNTEASPILFLAEPDSIIPTLSRESLQYTERTSLSIRDLMKKALQVLADSIDNYAALFRPQLITRCSEHSEFMDKMWTNNFSPYQYTMSVNRNTHIPGISQTTERLLFNNMQRWLSGKTPYMNTQVTDGKAFRQGVEQELETIFVQQLDRYTYLDKTKMLEVRAMGQVTYRHDSAQRDTMAQYLSTEVRKFRDIMRKTPFVSDVYYPSHNDLGYALHSNNPGSYFISTVDISPKLDEDLTEQMFKGSKYDFIRRAVYVNNTIVLSLSPKVMVARAIEHFLGSPHERRNPLNQHGSCARLIGARVLRIRAAIKESEVNSLADDLRKQGYTVILLMEPTAEEQKEARLAAEERARQKEIPLPILGDLVYECIPSWPINERESKQKSIKHLLKNEEFKGKPLYLILGRGKELYHTLQNLDNFKLLTKFVGNDIVCVSTKPEIAKVIKEGRTNVEDEMLAYAKQFFTRKDIKYKLFYSETFLVRLYKQNKYLTELLFGRKIPILTQEDKRILENFETLKSAFTSLGTYMYKKTQFRRKNRIARHFDSIFRKYGDRNFCDVNRALVAAYARRASPTRDLARSIMKTVMKEGK